MHFNSLTQEEFLSRVYATHGDKYNYSKVRYTGAFNKVTVICKVHGEFEVAARHLIRKTGCKECKWAEFRNKKADIETRLSEVSKGRYTYSIEGYTNNKAPIKCFCDRHGIFINSLSNLLRGQGCVRCKESRGEKLIAEWLKDREIHFIRGAKFKGCTNKRELPFDFWIPSKSILIEYDGEMHFRPFGNIRTGTNLYKFKNTQNNDKIKTAWAKKEGLKLIRIRYNAFKNIKGILEKEILWTSI